MRYTRRNITTSLLRSSSFCSFLFRVRIALWWCLLSIFFLANEIFKLAVSLLHHHWILLLINYSESEWARTELNIWRALFISVHKAYSPQDTASTTAIVEVTVAICLNSLINATKRFPINLWNNLYENNAVTNKKASLLCPASQYLNKMVQK